MSSAEGDTVFLAVRMTTSDTGPSYIVYAFSNMDLVNRWINSDTTGNATYYVCHRYVDFPELVHLTMQ